MSISSEARDAYYEATAESPRKGGLEAAAPIIATPYLDILEAIDLIIRDRGYGPYPAETKVDRIRSIIDNNRKAGIL